MATKNISSGISERNGAERFESIKPIKDIKRLTKIFDSESKILAKNSSWLLGSSVYQAGISFLKSVVIARSLGIDQYGTYVVVFAFVSTVQEIFNLNFGAALVKFSADYQKSERLDKVQALIKAGYVVSGIAALISIVAVGLVTILFYDVFFEVENLEWLVLIFAASSSLAFFNSVARVILRINDKFKINSLVNVVIYSLEFVIICLSLYLFKNNMIALVVSLSLVNLVSFFICNISAFLEVKDIIWGFWNEPLAKLREDRKALTGFLFNNSLSKTLQKLMKKGDVLLLAAFAGPAEVGLYDVARKLAFSLLMIKDPILIAVYPQIAQLIANNKIEKIKVMLRNVFVISSVPYLIGVTLIVLLNEWLIDLVYGEQFVGAGDALLLLILAIGLEIVLFWTVPYILSLGKTGYRLKASLVSAAVTLGVAFFLVNSFGATGIAFAILLGGIVLQSSFMLVILKHLRVTENE